MIRYLQDNNLFPKLQISDLDYQYSEIFLERPPALKDQIFLAEGATFQYTGNWTCHQRPPVLTDPTFYGQWGGLSRQVLLY